MVLSVSFEIHKLVSVGPGQSDPFEKGSGSLNSMDQGRREDSRHRRILNVWFSMYCLTLILLV